MASALGELREVLGEIDRLQARAAGLAGEVDAAQLFELDGAVSLVGWLVDQARMTSGDAARLAKTARRCRQLPVMAEAWATGELSGGQVQVIVANVSDRLVEGFAAGETQVVPFLTTLPVAETRVAVRQWRARVEAEVGDEREAKAAPSRFHHSETLEGRFESTGSWDADAGSVIDAAMKLAMTWAGDDDPRTPAERRADAEVAIHQHFLDHQRSVRGGSRRPHVNLVVRVDAEGNLEGGILDGPLLPQSTVEAYLCDCTAHRVIVDAAGAILDYGRATRTAPVDLRNAVILRDEHCRGPGCDRPPEWCDAHHVWPWEHGGPTSLDNLVLLCRRHHHLFHKPGWHDKLLPDGTYEVTDPHGRTRTTTPPGTVRLPSVAWPGEREVGDPRG